MLRIMIIKLSLCGHVGEQRNKAKAYKQEDLGLSDASHNIR